MSTPVITVIILIAAYSREAHCSVWIVPGTLDDFESRDDGVYDHITNYLPARGVLVCEKVPPESASEIAASTTAKFRAAGFDVQTEDLCDD